MKRLLIIEDDLNLALSVRSYFVEKGFDPVIVSDGPKGLQLASKNMYEVIIVDYCLPGLDGDKIISSLRRAGVETPILMLTGRNKPEDIAKSLRNGADDYLAKPFSILELEARVFRLITRPPVTKTQFIKIKDLELDSGSGVLKYGDNTAVLTKRELKLVAYLFLNRNYTVSREKLLVNVWGDKSELNSNTVDCYISNIRRKIGLKKNNEFIKTAHGFGYVLQV